LHISFLLIIHVNGIATCFVTCIKKHVRSSAPQYTIISLPQTSRLKKVKRLHCFL